MRLFSVITLFSSLALYVSSGQRTGDEGGRWAPESSPLQEWDEFARFLSGYLDITAGTASDWLTQAGIRLRSELCIKKPCVDVDLLSDDKNLCPGLFDLRGVRINEKTCTIGLQLKAVFRDAATRTEGFDCDMHCNPWRTIGEALHESAHLGLFARPLMIWGRILEALEVREARIVAKSVGSSLTARFGPAPEGSWRASLQHSGPGGYGVLLMNRAFGPWVFTPWLQSWRAPRWWWNSTQQQLRDYDYEVQ